MQLAWKPLTDRVIVRPFTLTTRQKGQRIVRPDQVRERPHLGKILALGPDANESLQEGDIVAFGKFAGVEVLVDARKLLVMRDTEVFLRQPGAELETVVHTIKGSDDEIVDELIHEAHSYCAECDPVNPDADHKAADEPADPPLVTEN